VNGETDHNQIVCEARPEFVVRIDDYPNGRWISLTGEQWLDIYDKSSLACSSRQVGGDHYRKMKIQPIEFIAANNLGFFEGTILKYLCRWKAKGGKQDLEKARHYLDVLIAQSEEVEK
jgi:hypothetical protein